jgi:hypothetical protein
MNLYTIKLLTKRLTGNLFHESETLVVAESIEAILNCKSYKSFKDIEISSIVLTKQNVEVIQ